MVRDIEGWGGPERMGLRRELADRAVLARGGIVAILLGAILFGLGELGTGGPELAFLQPLASSAGRWSALLCVGSGAIALLVSRARFWNRL
jgi:hypothetical protein